MNPLSKRIFFETHYILLTTLLSSLYVIFDQMFISKISLDYLSSEVVIAYLCVFYLILARVFGQAYVLKIREHSANGLALKTISTFFVFGSPILIFLVFRAPPILKVLSIPNLAGMTTYFIIYSLCGFLVGFNLLLKFMMLAAGKAKHGFYSDIYGNFLNIFGNSASLLFFKQESWKFIGIGFSSLIAQICVFLILIYELRKWVEFRLPSNLWKETIQFLKMTKHIISGDFVTNLLKALSPFLLTLVIRSRFGDLYAVGYNIAISLYFLFERPFISLSMALLPILVKSNKIETRDIINYTKSLSFYWSVIIVLAFCILPFFVPYIYNISDASIVGVISMVLSPSLLSAFFVLPISFLRINEKQMQIAFLELSFGDLATCTLLIFSAAFFSNIILIFGISFFLPKLLYVFLISNLGNREHRCKPEFSDLNSITTEQQNKNCIREI